MRLARDASGTSAASYAFASFHLGELARTGGDLRAAARHYEAALAADPTFVPALAGRARARRRARRHRRRGARLHRGRTPAAAARVRRRARRAVPRDGAAGAGRRAVRGRRPRRRLLAKANGVRTDLETALFEADHGSPDAALAAARAEWDARRSIHTADALGWALHAAGKDAEALRYVRLATRLGTQRRAAAVPPRRRRSGARPRRRRASAPAAVARRSTTGSRRGASGRPAHWSPTSAVRDDDPRRTWSVRIVAALAGAVAVLVASPGAASAHPLGNFTVNRYSGLVVSADDRHRRPRARPRRDPHRPATSGHRHLGRRHTVAYRAGDVGAGDLRGRRDGDAAHGARRPGAADGRVGAGQDAAGPGRAAGAAGGVRAASRPGRGG